MNSFCLTTLKGNVSLLLPATLLLHAFANMLGNISWLPLKFSLWTGGVSVACGSRNIWGYTEEKAAECWSEAPLGKKETNFFPLRTHIGCFRTGHI